MEDGRIIPQKSKSEKIIAFVREVRGVRSFLTGFDGEKFI
jgi:hypothetical protein